MVDIFQEVDEDLRREKLEKLWKRFGPYIIGAVVLFIAGMAGKVWYDQHVRMERMAESDRFQAALDDITAGKTDAGMTALAEISKDSKYGYAFLADLERASHLAAKGKLDDAEALYRKVADDSAIEKRYRDYARLNIAMIDIDKRNYDAASAALTPLMEKGGAWSYSARELKGLVDMETGDFETARKVFSELSLDNRTPPEMKQRASEFLAMIENRLPPEDLTGKADDQPLADDSKNVADGNGR